VLDLSVELRAVVGVLTPRVAELERQLRSGGDDSGTPTSTESIAALSTCLARAVQWYEL
jgi:hypothetical protein